MNFESLLKFGVDQGATAIHLQAGSMPQLRLGGLIRSVEGAALKGEDIQSWLATIAPGPVAEDLGRPIGPGAVFSATAGAAGRFRCTAFRQVDGPGVVLVPIPAVRGADELQLPPVARQVALSGAGLVVICGPSQSGRTTTLAALVDTINTSSHLKLVTVEEPVEYRHANKKALVTQMEVGSNVVSFEQGLESALRQDADAIALGDVRDAATARLALAAAEAGKKVLAVTTSPFAVDALARWLALVPPEDRATATAQLAGTLQAVFAQRLARTRDGRPRVAVEVLRGGSDTSKAILGSRLGDLKYLIEGRQNGMQSLDQHLVELQQAGLISGTETLRLASNPEVVAVQLRALKQSADSSRPAGASLPA